MQVRVKEEFFDRENDLKLRTAGEIFQVDPKRAEVLMLKGLVEKVPEQPGKSGRQKGGDPTSP